MPRMMGVLHSSDSDDDLEGEEASDVDDDDRASFP